MKMNRKDGMDHIDHELSNSPFLNTMHTLKRQNHKANYSIHIKPSHKGLLHKDLGIKQGKHIPLERLEKVAHSKNKKLRARAQFAINAKHFHHGD